MKLAAIFLAFAASAQYVPSGAPFATNGTNTYAYYATFTVQSAQITGTLTGFPALICANTTLGNGATCPTITDFNTAANGGKIQHTTTQGVGGYSLTVPADLIFTSDSMGLTKVPGWEFVSYSASGGPLVVWVNCPSCAVGTVIYAFYDNASVTSLQTTTANTWNASYLGVWHLPNGTTLYTPNSVTGVNGTTAGPPAAASAQIDGGAQFGAHSTDSIQTDISPTATTISVTLWSYLTGAGGSSFGRMIDNTNATLQGIALYNSSSGYQVQPDWSGGAAQWAYAAPSANAWHYVAFSYNGTSASNAPSFYLDGTSQSASSTTNVPPTGSWALTYPLYIGNRSDSLRNWAGSINEVRYYSGILTASWIAAEYNNQSAPNSFWTVVTGL